MEHNGNLVCSSTTQHNTSVKLGCAAGRAWSRSSTACESPCNSTYWHDRDYKGYFKHGCATVSRHKRFFRTLELCMAISSSSLKARPILKVLHSNTSKQASGTTKLTSKQSTASCAVVCIQTGFIFHYNVSIVCIFNVAIFTFHGGKSQKPKS